MTTPRGLHCPGNLPKRGIATWYYSLLVSNQIGFQPHQPFESKRAQDGNARKTGESMVAKQQKNRE
jgi:hypothetical protein